MSWNHGAVTGTFIGLAVGWGTFDLTWFPTMIAGTVGVLFLLEAALKEKQ